MKKINRLFPIILLISYVLICVILTTVTANAVENLENQSTSIEDITADIYDPFVIHFDFGNQYNHEVQMSTDPNFQVDCTTIDLGDAYYMYNDMLAPYTTYYFRARGYVETSPGLKQYTKWSSVKSFKYDLPLLAFTNIEIEDTILNLEWAAYKVDPSSYGYTEYDIGSVYGCAIEYSPSSNFDGDVKSVIIDNAHCRYSIYNDLIPNQTYYFRIRSCLIVDGQIHYQKNPVYQTYTYKVGAPVIIESGISYDGRTMIYFQGHNDSHVSKQMRVQISDSRNFDCILIDGITSETLGLELNSNIVVVIDNHFQPGKQYYARICYYTDKDTYFPWSTIVPIYYEPNSVQIKEITYSDNFKNTCVYFDSFLSNEENYKYLNYQIQFQYSSTGSFDNATTILLNEDEDYTLLRNLKSGVYISRARIVAYYGQLYESPSGSTLNYSDWSEITQFAIAADAPKLNAAKASDENITLNWSGIDSCAGYELKYTLYPDHGNSIILKIPSNAVVSTELINTLMPYYTYGFSIRAYYLVNGVETYTEWSNEKFIRYVPTKTYIKHLTLGNDQSVIVDWKRLDYCDQYEIQFSLDNQFNDAQSIIIKDKSDCEKYVYGLVPDAIYYFRIRAIILNDLDVYYTDWSNTKNIEFKSAKTYLTSQQIVDDNLKVMWRAVNGDAYEIQYCQDDRFESATTVRINSSNEITGKLSHMISADNFVPGTYYLRIRVIDIVDDVEYYTDWSNVKTVEYQLPKTYIKTLSKTGNQVNVNWKTLNTIDGYQVQYSDTLDFTSDSVIDVNTMNKDSLTIANISGMCFARIRTYKVIDGKTYYSDWSNPKVCGVKLTKTYITNKYIFNSQGVVVWKTTDDCDGYEIQAATDEQFTQNTQLLVVHGASIGKREEIAINTGTTYFRIRTYVTICGTKYYSDWSNAKTIEF